MRKEKISRVNRRARLHDVLTLGYFVAICDQTLSSPVRGYRLEDIRERHARSLSCRREVITARGAPRNSLTSRKGAYGLPGKRFLGVRARADTSDVTELCRESRIREYVTRVVVVGAPSPRLAIAPAEQLRSRCA